MNVQVSVITPTYNLIKNDRKDLFIQAVNSVQNQTYKNIEHIIIDNNSDDGTKELLEEFANEYKNFRYYSQKDEGIFDAFNKGVEKAKGKYIIFLNTDDFYHKKDGIEKCVDLLEKSDSDYCFSDCKTVLDKQQTYWDANMYMIFRAMPFCHQTLMCKKEILERYPFDTNYKIIADYDFILKLFLNKYKYSQLKYCFVTFNLGGLSFNPKNSPKIEEESKLLYKNVYSSFYNLTDEDLDKVTKTLVFPDELENFFSDFFENKDLYEEAKETIYAQKLKQLPKNALTLNIMRRKTDENAEKIFTFANKFKFAFTPIYQYLYKKLSENDRKLYLDFMLKRFGNIDTVDIDERIKLDKLFDEAEKIYQSRKYKDQPIEININNKKAKMISATPLYKTPEKDKEKQLLNYYEYVHTFILKEYITEGFEPEKGTYIFDCGASAGDSTIGFKLFYPNSPVIAIESDKKAFEFLRKNIRLNKYTDVTPVKTFITNEKVKNKTTIDEIVKKKKISKVGLIKFDIEGAERFALEGAKETIKRDKPVLIIPIYHLENDSFILPQFLEKLYMPMEFKLKWTEKRIWGMDCVLVVKFL